MPIDPTMRVDLCDRELNPVAEPLSQFTGFTRQRDMRAKTDRSGGELSGPGTSAQRGREQQRRTRP